MLQQVILIFHLPVFVISSSTAFTDSDIGQIVHCEWIEKHENYYHVFQFYSSRSIVRAEIGYVRIEMRYLRRVKLNGQKNNYALLMCVICTVAYQCITYAQNMVPLKGTGMLCNKFFLFIKLRSKCNMPWTKRVQLQKKKHKTSELKG